MEQPCRQNKSGHEGVLAVSWQDFHGICKALAVSVEKFKPGVILPIGRGGYYPGTLLAHLLQVEVHPLRISRRLHDEIVHKKPRWILEPPEMIAGQKVLVVDEICDSGETLRIVKEKVARMGGLECRCAVLYAHPGGAVVPDYIGIISEALILNPWDREILRNGKFQFHPEYARELTALGRQAGADLLIAAGKFKLAKG